MGLLQVCIRYRQLDPAVVGSVAPPKKNSFNLTKECTTAYHFPKSSKDFFLKLNFRSDIRPSCKNTYIILNKGRENKLNFHFKMADLSTKYIY